MLTCNWKLPIYAAAVLTLAIATGAAGAQRGRGAGMMRDDPAQQADMQMFHALLDHRAEITRKVTVTPDGIDTLTESNNPDVTKLLQAHVASMVARVEQARPIHRRDPLFAEIFRNANKIDARYELTPKGVRVIETSTDPYVAKLIQAHADVLNAFIANGHAEVMKNHPVPDAASSQAATQAQEPDHDAHHREMMQRGALAMGFDQEATIHHFLLYPDGGAIDVAVKEAEDHVNLHAIREHLPEIAVLFKAGDFGKPALTHAQEVPGTREMTRLKDRITYTYTETPGGGRVRILTRDRDALAAIHRFLRFQIEDHRTGDPEVVQRP